MSTLKIKNFTIGNQEPMTLMAGVNVLESEPVVMAVAEKFAETTSSLNINWIFKGSFDKANRSSISSFRGPPKRRDRTSICFIKGALKNPIYV